MESKKAVEPKFTADFLESVVREGEDELTLREDEGEEAVPCTFIDTTDVGSCRWRPPVVNDCQAICQDIFKGVERPEWEAMYYNHERHQAFKQVNAM